VIGGAHLFQIRPSSGGSESPLGHIDVFDLMPPIFGPFHILVGERVTEMPSGGIGMALDNRNMFSHVVPLSDQTDPLQESPHS